MDSHTNMLKFVLFTIYVSVAYGAKLPYRPVYDGQVQDPVHQSQVPHKHAVPIHPRERVPSNYDDAVHDAVTNKPVAIIQQESGVNPDGSFFNVWESENGIKVQEEGSVKVFAKDAVVQTVTGRFSYTDNDGTPFVLTYTADENGFQPQGDHLPTPPPIPIAIVKALEYIAAHPYVEPESVGHNDNPEVVDN